MSKQTINTLFYTDENKLGLKIHQLNANNLRCFELPRNLIQILQNEKFSDNAGIYFLIGNNENNNLIYIGQAENIVNRLRDHNKDSSKDWFSKIIFFTTENNLYSSTYLRYLEYHYIKKFNIGNKKWICKNVAMPSEPNISDFETPNIEAQIKAIDITLSCLDISSQNIVSEGKTNIFKLKKCKGVYKNGKFIILAGSIIPMILQKKFDSVGKDNKRFKEQNAKLTRLKNSIEKLIISEKVKRINDMECELMYDLECNSPSLAGCYACGHYAINGWNLWKNESGQDLDSIYRAK